MKFRLGGGRAPDKGQQELQTMHDIIAEIFKIEGTKEILHISFARTGIMHKNRNAFGPERFKIFVENLGIKYHDGRFFEDIEDFSRDTIYINGGNNTEYLFEMCQNEKLKQTINKAKVIIGESAGSMVFGEEFINNKEKNVIQSFGFIKNTIIRPHYTQRRNEELEKLFMKEQEKGFQILGIDETTFVEYKDGNYGEKIGTGNFYQL